VNVERSEPEAAAGAYPFDQPLESFVFAGGRVERLSEAAFAGRWHVLAIGANAAPSRLALKFRDLEGTMPVARTVLAEEAVVFSAHLTRYGALPATLHPAPGARVYVLVTWLTPAQRARMHETEGLGRRYDYVERTDLRLESEAAPLAPSQPVGLYLSRAGPLRLGSRPVRQAQAPTTNCPLPALTQRAALRLCHRRLAPGLDFDSFLRRLVEDAAFRGDIGERLRLWR